MRKVLVCAEFLLAAAAAFAADIYVDNAVGNDAFNGAAKAPGAGGAGPFATIDKALRAAAPGDTAHITPTGTIYRQMASFYGLKGGAPGKPITLDGHGVTLCGSDPCPPAGWKPWKNGVLTRDDMVSKTMLMVDDRMVFSTLAYDVLKPGEVCYMVEDMNRLNFNPPEGKKAEECAVEVGQPDGSTVALDPKLWQRTHSRIPAARRYPGLKKPTWIKVDGRETPLVTAKERLGPGEWCAEEKTLYYRPPEGRAIGSLKIECVVRECGVAMSGETAHVVVRNLNATRVWNDGYNIHGHVTNASFHNCNAWECGDEGFSAHDRCETLLDGAVYEYCDNAIANVNSEGFSITRNVVLAKSRSVGFLLQGNARHELTNAILVDNPAQFAGLNTTADNVLIVATPDSGLRQTQAVRASGKMSFSRLTTAGNTGLVFMGEGSLSLTDCLLADGRPGIHARLADPAATLRLTNTWFSPGMTIEWGTAYPWKVKPLAEWLEEGAKSGIAARSGVRPAPWTAALLKGERPADMPADAGCTAELLSRYAEYMKTRK